MQSLGRDPLTKIAINSDPRDVLSLCRTNRRFAQLCREDSFWYTLMDAHFPDLPHMEPIREHYKMLALDKGTEYYFYKPDGNTRLTTGRAFKEPNDEEIPSIKVLGLGFPSKTTKWCVLRKLLIDQPYYKKNYRIVGEVSMNRNDAVQKAVEVATSLAFYVNLDVQVEELENYFQADGKSEVVWREFDGDEASPDILMIVQLVEMTFYDSEM